MKASCFATSVLPTPVGPENRNEPIGLSVLPSPARAILMADASASMAGSWPKTTFFRSRSMVCSLLRSSWLTVCGGMRAILAMISSISSLADGLLLLRLRQDALRGTGLVDDVDGLVRQMTVVDEARRQLRRRSQRRGRVLDAVVLFEARLQAAQDLHGLLDVGSLTSIFWKRRDSAWSFSNTPRYSVIGGRADAFQLPAGDSAGLSRLDASSVPPEAAPAPIRVWISSMNRMRVRIVLAAASARPSGAARSRRGTWCRPAARPCRANTRLAVCKDFRHVALRRCARPGLRQWRSCPRRPRRPAADCSCAGGTAIWITRSTSRSRPISGSILPSSGRAVQILREVIERRFLWPAFGLPLFALAPALSARRLCWSLVMPCEMKLTTSSRVTPC